MSAQDEHDAELILLALATWVADTLSRQEAGRLYTMLFPASSNATVWSAMQTNECLRVGHHPLLADTVKAHCISIRKTLPLFYK